MRKINCEIQLTFILPKLQTLNKLKSNSQKNSVSVKMPRNNDIGLEEFGRRKVEYHMRKIEERIERERYNKIMTKKEVQALQRAQIEELFRNNYSTWG